MKTIIISILAIIQINCTAQIKPISSIEIGQGSKVIRMYEIGHQNLYPAINRTGQYTEITIGANHKNIKLRSNVTTYMNYNNNYGFSPWLSVYTIKLEYSKKYISMGVYHHCSHFNQSNQSYTFGYSNTEDRIYIKINLLK